jgi:hypothetical protein
MAIGQDEQDGQTPLDLDERSGLIRGSAEIRKYANLRIFAVILSAGLCEAMVGAH